MTQQSHFWDYMLRILKHQFDKMCVTYFYCSVTYNSQDLEVAQVPISKWVDKKTVVHLHNGILGSCKKEENLSFCDSMDGPGEHYAKWNKPVRESHVPYKFNHMWSKLMNKLN